MSSIKNQRALMCPLCLSFSHVRCLDVWKSNLFWKEHSTEQVMSATTPTAAQIETLLNFLEEHRDLARGLLRNVEGRTTAKRLWENISVTLNAMGGCTKSIKQWQKVWTDKKYLAKKAAGAARTSVSATGGGPSSAPQLSQCDLRVISIMGDGFGEPQTTARVPLFIEQTQESTVQEAQGESLPSQQLLLSDQLPAENRQPTEPPEPTEPHIQPNMSSQAQCTRRPRARRHQSGSLADGSVRERLFSLEEERREREIFSNERLASIDENLGEIKLALQEMCRLVKQVTETQSMLLL